MSTKDRDTHFLGFADLLQSKLESISPCTRQEASLVIAQGAYDLVYHALKTSEEHDLFADNFFGYFSLDTEAKLTEIPDLTELPTPPASEPASPVPD